MADYISLEQMLNTTANMSAIRNNAKNDDGTDTVVGVPWFMFNGVAASNIYVSGNNWIGFGSSSEQLKICRRDGAVWYVYREEGTVKGIRFLKLRIEGYTVYSSTAASCALKYEIFLFDTGSMFLNIVLAPTDIGSMGTSEFVCGTTKPLPAILVNTQPVYYTFTPKNSAGSDWDITNSLIVLKTKQYSSSGSVVYPVTAFQSITQCRSAVLTWQEKLPANTSIEAYAALSASTPTAGDYVACSNGKSMPNLTNANMANKTLYIKFVLRTSDLSTTPTLTNFSINAEDVMVQDFVPSRMPYTFKVFCDLKGRMNGITILNKAKTLLRFANGELLSPFSVNMLIAGLPSVVDIGYLYDIVKFQINHGDARDSGISTSLYPNVSIPSCYETAHYPIVSSNQFDNASIKLT